jgi:hypothetical protein
MELETQVGIWVGDSTVITVVNVVERIGLTAGEFRHGAGTRRWRMKTIPDF